MKKYNTECNFSCKTWEEVSWEHPVTDFDVSGAAGCGHVTGSNIIFNRKTNVKREILLSHN